MTWKDIMRKRITTNVGISIKIAFLQHEAGQSLVTAEVDWQGAAAQDGMSFSKAYSQSFNHFFLNC